MFDLLIAFREWVRDSYSHSVTTALGFGVFTSAVDLGSKLLGLVAIAFGLYCSHDRLRRDREEHAQRMRAGTAPQPGSDS